MSSKCGCKKFSKKLKRKENQIELKKDHEVILSILARHGLHGEELKLFLEKHGIEEGSAATQEQLQMMYNDLKTKQLLDKEVSTHDQLLKQTEELQRKLDIIEENLADMSRRVTNLLGRTSHSEPQKQTRFSL